LKNIQSVKYVLAVKVKGNIMTLKNILLRKYCEFKICPDEVKGKYVL
jgi:hypothetical protein